MFKKTNGSMAKNNDADSGAHNQIAKGTTIRGDISTDGVLRIDGSLIGSIQSKSKVVVGPTGKVEGEVHCESANISGEVKARITVKGLLALQATARLVGEITTGKLSIEPGAVFSGKCSMGGIVKELSHEKSEENRETKERELAHAK